MKKLAVCLSVLAMFVSPAFAADSKDQSADHKMHEPTTEQRAAMATMHEKLATCLRSTKTMKDCHQEMMEACKVNKDACPPMMMHHHGKGGHDHKMMEHESSESK